MPCRDGRLKPGDEILMVDGKSLVGLSHSEAVSVLKTTQQLVQLVVATEVRGKREGREGEREEGREKTLLLGFTSDILTVYVQDTKCSGSHVYMFTKPSLPPTPSLPPSLLH